MLTCGQLYKGHPLFGIPIKGLRCEMPFIYDISNVIVECLSPCHSFALDDR